MFRLNFSVRSEFCLQSTIFFIWILYYHSISIFQMTWLMRQGQYLCYFFRILTQWPLIFLFTFWTFIFSSSSFIFHPQTHFWLPLMHLLTPLLLSLSLLEHFANFSTSIIFPGCASEFSLFTHRIAFSQIISSSSECPNLAWLSLVFPLSSFIYALWALCFFFLPISETKFHKIALNSFKLSYTSFATESLWSTYHFAFSSLSSNNLALLSDATASNFGLIFHFHFRLPSYSFFISCLPLSASHFLLLIFLFPFSVFIFIPKDHWWHKIAS